MHLKIILLAGAVLCLPNLAYATGVDTPPPGTDTTPPTETPATLGDTGGGIYPSSQSGSSSQSNSSASSVSGATSSSGASSGSNTTTTIDASNRSVSRSTAVFIPSVVPMTPPSQLAVGNIIRETFACGPMQRVVHTRVTGTFIGLFSNTDIPQGWSDVLEPYFDASGIRVEYRLVRAPNGDVRMFGHQVSMFTSVIGVASNRNIAIGGGGEGGSWGQAGMGSSSSNQQLVTTIQLRDCEIGVMHEVAMEEGQNATRPPRSIRQ